jgi:putative transposase
LSQRLNTEVVERIQDIQSDDDLRCGYKRMRAQLELQGYQINDKKIYRLMKQGDLLLTCYRSERGPYVTHRCARPDKPLTLLEMDIKMFWVEEYRRYAFVLTIIDTFTRVALHWSVGYSMKWTAVRSAWEAVIEDHLQPADMLAKGFGIEVRSDNGPQFLATRLREFFAENHLCQVYTHPYTPQENGHVESFHAIIGLALRHDTFWTLEQLEIRLTIFYDKYNNSRVHSAVAMLPPNLFWEVWKEGKVTARKNKRGKLIFKLTVPRYLINSSLKLEAELRSNDHKKEKRPPQSAPQANAGKQQNLTPAAC